ncbi:MAG TPA: hypothetical protein VL221_15125 [Bacteroidota bacterium]|nr:hypothetical protein [Bacteroidota bacterium]
MKRRTVLEILGASAGAYVLQPGLREALSAGVSGAESRDEIAAAFSRLRGEPACRSSVRTERGGPRLFVNGRETYPLLALSDELLKTAAGYRDAGIAMFTPILGLNAAWKAPGVYDWTPFDLFFARLLAIHPPAFLLPRLHLNPPAWWKESHPDELVRCGLTPDPSLYRQPERLGETGLNWNGLADPNDASWASTVWRSEMADVLSSFIRHMEASPLVARVIGYQVAYGHTGEWHYTGMRFLPDYSSPMQRAIGPIPAPVARMTTKAGLLRDPALEHDVIEFYARHHDLIADTLLYFARITKDLTGRRILCGAFFGYLLENVHIQEGGHLSPERVLASSDIDFLASPYTYQHTNIPGQERWESDVVDDAGNLLGRARGVGGDGGYRVLVESIHRHGKLFFVEMDPSTYIEPKKVGEGGSGHDSVGGSVRILRRDLAQMFARGVGGWFFDFGHLCPPYQAHHGWYDDPPLVEAIRPFAALGAERARLDTTSAAEIACVYDPKAFFATEHWKGEEPWTGYGIAVCDHFNHWFINSQQRALARMSAPYDSLYKFDVTPSDVKRYRLLFLVNLFYMDDGETEKMAAMLEGSGVTVVWYYAPGFIAPGGFAPEHMERLTGFRFSVLPDPGPMQVHVEAMSGVVPKIIGTSKHQHPRFALEGDDMEVFGRWVDNGRPAFARRPCRGWTSIYTGTAPLTSDILRRIAADAGAAIWSDRHDIVYATRDAAAVIATGEGERTLRFPKAMQSVDGRAASREHTMTMAFGDVHVFVAPPARD